MPGVRRLGQPGGEPRVGVPAGLGDHRDGEPHAWTADQPGLQRGPQPAVDEAGVPHRGDAEPQRGSGVGHRRVERQGERLEGGPAEVQVAEAEVHVAVEQSGQDGRAGHVHRLVAVQPGPDVHDPAVLEHDVRVRGGAQTMKTRPPARSVRVFMCRRRPGRRSRRAWRTWPARRGVARRQRLPARRGGGRARRRRRAGRGVPVATSRRIRSPSRDEARSGPPSTASGATWPTHRPVVPPENRPSVSSRTSLPRPAPLIAPVIASISRMPGPPLGPS